MRMPPSEELMASPQTLPLQPVADQPEPDRAAGTLEDVPDTDVTNYDPRAPWGEVDDDPENPWRFLE